MAQDPKTASFALDFVWWNPFVNPLRAWTCEGYLCAIAPGYSAINGYVRLPSTHPWYGVPYDQIDVDVHGGLTFGIDNPEIHERMRERMGANFPERTEEETYGWIGFDTAHAFDKWSEEELTRAGFDTNDKRYTMMREIESKYPISPHEWDTSWTVERLIEEVNNLARQVAAAGTGDRDHRGVREHP